MTPEIDTVIRLLESPQILVGFHDGVAEILDPTELLRIYAEESKVFAATDSKLYTLRQRLYALEECLPYDFVRISNSEIISLKKVKQFDLRLSGTICVRLTDGTVTYVSRRYVSKIKQLLGV